MSNMDTIKVADGDYRIAKVSLDFVYTVYHFHRKKRNLRLLAASERSLDFSRLTTKGCKNTLTFFVRQHQFCRAEVAELVDALGSGSSGGFPVGVRVSPSAPQTNYIFRGGLAMVSPLFLFYRHLWMIVAL